MSPLIFDVPRTRFMKAIGTTTASKPARRAARRGRSGSSNPARPPGSGRAHTRLLGGRRDSRRSRPGPAGPMRDVCRRWRPGRAVGCSGQPCTSPPQTHQELRTTSVSVSVCSSRGVPRAGGAASVHLDEHVVAVRQPLAGPTGEVGRPQPLLARGGARAPSGRSRPGRPAISPVPSGTGVIDDQVSLGHVGGFERRCAASSRVRPRWGR